VNYCNRYTSYYIIRLIHDVSGTCGIRDICVIRDIPLGLQLKSTTMNFPAELRYTKDHEWISLDGNTATIGITDFAQRELGDIVYVEVDTIGKELQAGAVFGTVEAVKTVSDLFLPVTGTITELNPALATEPELVNNDPYGKGWMVKMTVLNPADVNALLDAKAYEAVTV